MREYLAASLMAAVVGSTTCTAVAAHEGWFVRVCPTKNRVSSNQFGVLRHAYVCVGFRDHIVQRMEFDYHENHQINWNDADDCAC